MVKGQSQSQSGLLYGIPVMVIRDGAIVDHGRYVRVLVVVGSVVVAVCVCYDGET